MNEKKGRKRNIFIAAAIAAVLIIAAVSVYAVSSDVSRGRPDVAVNNAITKAEAEQTALAQVNGANSSHIVKSEESYDDGRMEYEIEIVCDGYRHDFAIAADDGSILHSSHELTDDYDAGANTGRHHHEGGINNGNGAGGTMAHSQQHHNGISRAEAKAIALAQVSGANNSDIVKMDEDYDNGRYTYEIEIHYDGYEYEFEIDKASGNIIDKDIDLIN